MISKKFIKQMFVHFLAASIVASGTLAFTTIDMKQPAYAEEIVISSNGSNSDNQVSVSSESTTTVNQSNDADIQNNVDTSSNTGGNEINGTTGGDAHIVTGDASQNIEITNQANQSVVKEECCETQGSSVTVSGNGAYSTNVVDVNQRNTTNVNVTQDANITNNVNGSANTGYNKITGSTGGDSSINTGDIKVSGEIVNKNINTSHIKVAKNNNSSNVKVSGNGFDSVNVVRLTYVDLVNIDTDFNADIYNNADWDLNTGKNIAKNNTGGDVKIATGDIDFNFLIKNEKINFGSVLVPCCKADKPDGEKPNGEKPDNGNGEEKPKNGDKENGKEDKPTGGVIIAAAAEAEKKVGQVLGLSPTSGNLAENPLVFWAGLLMFTLGLSVVGKTFLQEETLPAN